MSDKDMGNATTQKMYEIATEPVFVDRSNDEEKEVSWDVATDDGSIHDKEVPATPENGIPSDQNQEPLEKENVQEDDIFREEGPEQSTQEQIEEEKEKKKKKNRTSERNRISQITRELKQAQAFAHDILTRNQYLEQKVAKAEKDSLTNQENYLTAQKERIKKYLTDAIEEGDSSKIADAQDLLAQYNSEILWLSKQKPSNAVDTNAPTNQQYDNNVYQQNLSKNYETQYNPYEETGKEWVKENPWADPKSSDFDEKMYREADHYSLWLKTKYELDGRADEVGSQEFFEDITNYMTNSYDIVDTEPLPSKPQHKDRMQMKTDKSPPQVPVNKQPMQNSDRSRTSNTMSLTQEQKEIAHSLRGFVRDPKTGEKITDSRTLEEIYKRNLMRSAGHGA